MSNIVMVAGNLDGIVPLEDPNGCWKEWALKEIFTGDIGEGKFIPKKDDYVRDTDTGEQYIVTAVDQTTFLSTLRRLKQQVPDSQFSDTDVLMGVGPGTPSDTFRVYIDRSVLPHQLCVDARLAFGGTMVKYCRIFKGSTLNGQGKVISAQYDQSGNLLGSAIPLERLTPGRGTVPVCSTSEELEDGEIVTIVAYDDAGGVVSKRQLLVENTGFIRTANSSQKYITAINLESPFLAPTDPSVMRVPQNVPISGLNIFGVVNYSDGTKLRMPVDNTKFELFGLDRYLNLQVGQRLPLVLKYNLSANEVAYGATVTSDKFFTKNYTVVTTKTEGAYTVKLFGYPVWIDSDHGYRLEWFIFDLDRKVYSCVTPYVQIITDVNPAFNGRQYGALQWFTASINLQDVNGTYKKVQYSQNIGITLLTTGDDHTHNNWTIQFEPNQKPPYGLNNAVPMTFIDYNHRTLDISLGETDLPSWLKRLYYQTLPLIDPDRETVPPEPNMFSLVFGNNEVSFPISQWNKQLAISNQLTNSGTLFIKFFKRTVETDILLSIAGVPVYQIN